MTGGGWQGSGEIPISFNYVSHYSSESDMMINEPLDYFKQGYFHDWFLFSMYHWIHHKMRQYI